MSRLVRRGWDFGVAVKAEIEPKPQDEAEPDSQNMSTLRCLQEGCLARRVARRRASDNGWGSFVPACDSQGNEPRGVCDECAAYSHCWRFHAR